MDTPPRKAAGPAGNESDSNSEPSTASTPKNSARHADMWTWLPARPAGLSRPFETQDHRWCAAEHPRHGHHLAQGRHQRPMNPP